MRLIDAAFGDACGVFPLPVARGPEERWLRAVTLGGQGRYAAAGAEIDQLLEDRTTPAQIRSLAFSATASHLRQCGLHSAALAWDGRALAMADTDDACADALIGLAADNLGRGDFAASERLLMRASQLMPPAARAEESWWRSGRLALRLHWVSAELALYSGRVEQARMVLADTDDAAPSLRHRLKTALISAATAAAVGDTDGATAMATTVFTDAREHGQRPLQWASAMMLRSIDPDGSWADSVQELSTWMYVPRAGLRRPVGVDR